MHRVGRGARTVVIGVFGRVSHVRLVVRRIKIDTIPARWEENLSSHAVRASLVWQVVVLGGNAGVVKADIADGLASEVISRCALEWVASKHAETLRESSKIVVVWATSLPIHLSVLRPL